MNAPVTISPGLHDGDSYSSPVTRVLAFGYYDGPTEGVLQVGPAGEVYRFTMTEDFPGEGVNDTDLRTFALSPLPPGSLEALAQSLAPYHEARWPLWVPIWRFPSTEIQKEVEGRIDRLLEQAAPAVWEVTTDNLFGVLRRVRRLHAGDGNLRS